LSEQWQNWRNKRDELSKIGTVAMTEQQKVDLEDQQKQLQKDKPQPIVPAFVYAYSIAQLNADQGIELLQYNLAEARRGAWEGLAKIADIALLKKLDKIRENNKENPILHHAAYRAIDLSLITIRNKVKKQDMQALDAYLKQLENIGRQHSNPDLSKNDPVALRIEWTRDRIKEGLQSIKRVECRAENWFKTKWPEKGCP